MNTYSKYHYVVSVKDLMLGVLLFALLLGCISQQSAYADIAFSCIHVLIPIIIITRDFRIVPRSFISCTFVLCIFSVWGSTSYFSPFQDPYPGLIIGPFPITGLRFSWAMLALFYGIVSIHAVRKNKCCSPDNTKLTEGYGIRRLGIVFFFTNCGLNILDITLHSDITVLTILDNAKKACFVLNLLDNKNIFLVNMSKLKSTNYYMYKMCLVFVWFTSFVLRHTFFWWPREVETGGVVF